MVDVSKIRVRCEKCQSVLDPNKVIWLELSITDGKYYLPEQFPEGHESQGCFSFGIDCAHNQLKEK